MNAWRAHHPVFPVPRRCRPRRSRCRFGAAPSGRRRSTRSPFGRNHAAPDERAVLSWVLGFLVIALIAAVFGFMNIAGAAAAVAQIAFAVFFVLALVSLVAVLARQPSRRS